MLSSVLGLIFLYWKRSLHSISKLWSRVAYFNPFRPETRPPDSRPPRVDARESDPHRLRTEEFPPTEDQERQARKAFIQSLDAEAVCALASRHNHHKSCKVIKRDNGSFNVCYFIEFEQVPEKWTIRIPIDPDPVDGWDKLLSEVTTVE